jgi:hypothetical protein
MMVFLAAGPVLGQDEAHRGDYISLKLAVMGPGDELYFWWGHIALVIEDAATGRDYFYDWGVFSFDNDHFFTNFALGRLVYSCAVSWAEGSYAHYQWANRDVTLYTLDLPAETKDEIRRFAENNVQPENRDYFYHHFRDNCSTRIRDILDAAIEGQFKAAFGEAPGRYTLREHIRRHMWFNPFFDWFLNFLMGRGIDQPIKVWDELFLPGEMGSRILDFSYTGAGGLTRPLVSSVESRSRAAGRPAILDEPLPAGRWELAAGCVLSIIMACFLILRQRRPGPGRAALGIGQSLLGLFFGGCGLVLFFMSFFTNHDYTYHNANLLYVNPLLLAAVPLGIILARGGPRAARADRLLQWLWTYVFLAGLITQALNLIPALWQGNLATAALVLPWSLLLSLIPRWLSRKR